MLAKTPYGYQGKVTSIVYFAQIGGEGLVGCFYNELLLQKKLSF